MPVETYDPKIDVHEPETTDPLAGAEKRVDTPDNTVEEANMAEITTEQFRKQLAELGVVAFIEHTLDADDSPVDINEVLRSYTVEDGSGRHNQLRGAFVFGLLLLAARLERERQKGRDNYFNAMTGMPMREPYHKPSALESRLRLHDELMGRTQGAGDSTDSDFRTHVYGSSTGTFADYVTTRPSTDRTRKPRRSAHGYGSATGGYFSAQQSTAHLRGKPAYERFMHGKRPGPAAPTPDFVPAPSMGSTQEGPQLPFLYNPDERVQANDMQGSVRRRSTKGELQNARLANAMYERALYDVGWRGGDITNEQKHSAYREMGKKYREHGTAEEQEAYKAFVVTQDKPEHVADRKAGHEAKKAAARAETAAEQQQAAPSEPTPPANPSAN